MTKLMEFPLEDGTTIFVEVEPEHKITMRGGSSDHVVERATETFESALDRIRPAAGLVIAKLRDISIPPQQIGVEFGIKLSADAKAYIASASAEANFKVTLTWKRDE